MSRIILDGGTVADLLEQFRAVIKHELTNSSSPNSLPEIGGIELAIEVTRLSKARIYALVSQRSIPHSKPAGGNKLYFNRQELLNWVARGSRPVQQTAH